MIDIHKDTFARLAISAQKNKGLNKPFRSKTSRVPSEEITEKKSINMPTPKNLQTEHSIDKKILEANILETTISEKNISYPQKGLPKSTGIIPKTATRTKIEEKVSQMIENPEIQALQKELLVAEDALKRLKKIHADKEFISKLESKILELKEFIETKKYV